MPTEEKAKYADVIVNNDGSLDDLRNKVEELWKDRLSTRGLAGRQND